MRPAMSLTVIFEKGISCRSSSKSFLIPSSVSFPNISWLGKWLQCGMESKCSSSLRLGDGHPSIVPCASVAVGQNHGLV